MSVYQSRVLDTFVCYLLQKSTALIVVVTDLGHPGPELFINNPAQGTQDPWRSAGLSLLQHQQVSSCSDGSDERIIAQTQVQ